MPKFEQAGFWYHPLFSYLVNFVLAGIGVILSVGPNPQTTEGEVANSKTEKMEARDRMVVRLGQAEDALVNAYNALTDADSTAGEMGWGITQAVIEDVLPRIDEQLEAVRKWHSIYLSYKG